MMLRNNRFSNDQWIGLGRFLQLQTWRCLSKESRKILGYWGLGGRHRNHIKGFISGRRMGDRFHHNLGNISPRNRRSDSIGGIAEQHIIFPHQ